MQKKSSSSVKVYYPKYSVEDIVIELRKSLNILSKELGIEKAILFGSYAKKSYTIASDIDILIVFDETKSDEDKVYKTLRKSIKLSRIELHIISKTDYNMARASKWITTIEKEGIKILNN
ncbi:MAG: nucleotidyltransferase domain-containing protein [Nitrososphaeria archaeon]